MSHTPRSRTISRASTPGLPLNSPSRLTVLPTLKPTPSTSNLHIHSHNVASASNLPEPTIAPSSTYDSALDSSASSVINLDMNEGILIQDMDVETDTMDGAEFTVSGTVNTGVDEEEPKKLLREQLRKTLSHRRTSNPDVEASRLRVMEKLAEIQDLDFPVVSRYPEREYYVLTNAGKPVFIRHVGHDQDNVASIIGIMQALISVFLDDNDKLRCINAGRTRITFLLRQPLYYACVSSWGEPESVTRSHLEYLHLQILSIVTASQLRRIFERRTNFDLRRLLNGAELFLTSLLDRLEFDVAMSTSSLHCLKLDYVLRKRIAETLVPTSKMKDVLYILLIVQDRVVTLIRPKKHSIHPADIHILLNTIHSPSIRNSPASASWIPVCLPKFNPAGFVNAYISFLRKENNIPKSQPTPTGSQSSQVIAANVDSSKPPHGESADIDNAEIVLCCISTGDLESVRNWSDLAIKKLTDDNLLHTLASAYSSGQTEYSVSELGIPGLRHFVYKSRPHVQVTLPTFEDPYDNIHQKRRIVTLYQTLHDAIHAKSGQEGMLKLQYIRTESESVMGWVTQPFELYIALSPWLPKSAAVGAANAVARWVKKEEGRVFLRDAPVF